MAVSDAILTRLLSLHPKIIDLSLDRMHRILARLGNPERQLPPVIHIAGTNGKGSTLAFLRAIMEAAGLRVHAYTSPHLVKFHERIRLAGEFVSEDHLSALLEECERANDGDPITFFEITTAAAFLAFARQPADYLLLEVGLGGRLDATNVIAKPKACCITSIGLDHQQYLGETIELIAREKAGILKQDISAVVGHMPAEARAAIEAVAEGVNAPLSIAGRDWDSHMQHGRMVFQDQAGLLDLPPPSLPGPHQIGNAGNAIATLRAIADPRISEDHMAQGLRSVQWPARLQRLKGGALSSQLPEGSELWLDGGHNADAGVVLAQALKALPNKPLILIWGMLNSKDHAAFIRPLVPLAEKVFAVTIPDEPNAVRASVLAETVNGLGGAAATSESFQKALQQASQVRPAARVLICGSLYLAGHVLAAERSEAMSAVTGAARR
jgi:dihydrofolate synthase / folylpolyglutamate synthase